jgi:hypothetical protein
MQQARRPRSPGRFVLNVSCLDASPSPIRCHTVGNTAEEVNPRDAACFSAVLPPLNKHVAHPPQRRVHSPIHPRNGGHRAPTGAHTGTPVRSPCAVVVVDLWLMHPFGFLGLPSKGAGR